MTLIIVFYIVLLYDFSPMSGYRGQESHFEHYLWQELESPSFLSLQEVLNCGPGALFWSKSGDLEEVVVHTQDGLFYGIKYEKIIKPSFSGGNQTIVCNTRIAMDAYNNGGYAPGTVKPYVYLGQVSPETLNDDELLFRHLLEANLEVYTEKLSWLLDMKHRVGLEEDPGFAEFYSDAANRYQRLVQVSSGNAMADL